MLLLRNHNPLQNFYCAVSHTACISEIGCICMNRKATILAMAYIVLHVITITYVTFCCIIWCRRRICTARICLLCSCNTCSFMIATKVVTTTLYYNRSRLVVTMKTVEEHRKALVAEWFSESSGERDFTGYERHYGILLLLFRLSITKLTYSKC